MKKQKILTVLLLLCVLILMLFLGGMQAGKPRLICEESAYSSLLQKTVPQLPLDSAQSGSRTNIFSEIQGGSLAACLDVQALPAVHAGIRGHFTPHGLATVVFAVDPEKTHERPDSWAQLLQGTAVVGLPRSPAQLRLILGAAAYGLEGETYEKQGALELFRALYEQGKLETADDSPVRICLDIEAAGRIRAGEKLEILVPRDGTLSFALGVFSSETYPQPDENALLAAGLRLENGKAQWEGYSGNSAYGAAARVSDLNHFLEVTQNASRDFRRTVFGGFFFNSADGREAVLLMVGTALLILFWTAGALYRSADEEMRQWVWMLSGQMLAWIALWLLKYQFPAGSAGARICWYSAYIFLMGLPLTMLYVGISVDMPPQNRSFPHWFQALLLMHPPLMLLVYTNDVHGLLFRLNVTENQGQVRMPGIGYYMIFAYCTLCIALSLFFLIQKSRKSPKFRAFLFPTVFSLLMILYLAAYAAEIPAVVSSNLPVVLCLFSIFYLESIQRAGLIPTNTGYRELFSSSPLHMQLLDQAGRTVLQSEGAVDLTRAQRKRILTQPETAFYQTPDILLHNQMIPGGFAIWQEDVRELNQLQKNLQVSVERMKTTNELLRRQSQIRKQNLMVDIKNQLFDQLEQEIAGQTNELSRVIRELDASADRKKEISYLPLLLCHLKRRCNLFFLSKEGKEMSSNELTVYLDELSEFASYSSIRALVRCGISGSLPVEQGILCYDFYFLLLSWAVRCSGAVLIGQLEMGAGGPVFSILSSEPSDSLDFGEEFRNQAKRCGARISQHMVEETQGIYLTVEGSVQ